MEFKENLIVMNEITLPQPSSFESRGRQKGSIETLIDARTHIEAFIVKGKMIECFDIQRLATRYLNAADGG